MIVRVRDSFLCLLLSTCVTVVGCSSSKPPSGTITGKVYVGDELLPFGEITFMDADGNKTAGPVRNGLYRLASIPLGTWKIGVVSRSQAYPGQMPAGASPFSGPNRPVSSPPTQRSIPEHYQEPERSGLSVTIRKGEQQQDFHLTLEKP